MKKISTYSLGLSLTAAVMAAAPSFGATLFDSNGFEAPTYTLGNLSGQHGWQKDGTGTAVVQNAVVQSGSQAVILSGTQTTWHWPDLGFTPVAGDVVRVTSGIYRASSASSTKSFGFFLDAYNFSVARIARAGLGIESDGNPSLWATVGANSTTLQSGLLWDTWYTVTMDLKFASQSYDVYLDGVLKGSDLTLGATFNNLGDVDLQHSFAAGATDVGYFDNYKIELNPGPIPEPAAGSVLLLGLAALFGRGFVARRR